MKRPAAHRTGHLGELRASQFLTEYGWIVAKNDADYGIDLVVQRTEGSNLTGDFALVQVKATRNSRKQPKGGVATLSVHAKHLDLWRSIPAPLFLAFVVVPSNEVFILDCHALALQLSFLDYSHGKQPASRSIVVPSAALGTSERMAEMARCVATFWAEMRQRSQAKPKPEVTTEKSSLATTLLIGGGLVGITPVLSLFRVLPASMILGGGFRAALGRKEGASSALSRGAVGRALRSDLVVDLSSVVGSTKALRLVDGALQNPE